MVGSGAALTISDEMSVIAPTPVAAPKITSRLFSIVYRSCPTSIADWSRYGRMGARYLKVQPLTHALGQDQPMSRATTSEPERQHPVAMTRGKTNALDL